MTNKYKLISNISHIAYATSCIVTALCVYNTLVKPVPVIGINYDATKKDEQIDVSIESSNKATLAVLDIKHNNLGCLKDRGYLIKHPVRKPIQGENILEIINVDNKRFSFADDCVACKVNSDIKYETSFGIKTQRLEWI